MLSVYFDPKVVLDTLSSSCSISPEQRYAYLTFLCTRQKCHAELTVSLSALELDTRCCVAKNCGIIQIRRANTTYKRDNQITGWNLRIHCSNRPSLSLINFHLFLWLIWFRDISNVSNISTKNRQDTVNWWTTSTLTGLPFIIQVLGSWTPSLVAFPDKHLYEENPWKSFESPCASFMNLNDWLKEKSIICNRQEMFTSLYLQVSNRM